MLADLKALYAMMLRSRLFEEQVQALWEQGRISGEMHMSVGEEGIVAGVVSLLREDDALALDHRGTAPLLMWGEDPVLLMKEILGRPDGLCRGQGGHMHLFSQKHMAASSGIVGASGPTAAGFALALQRQGKDALAVAFFGEGSMNQGMLLESMNLAAAWKLPVVFVCKDNGLSITTVSSEVTGGNLLQRAQGLGLTTYEADGTRVESVQSAASLAFQEVREGGPPAFLLARCFHYEGHFLGDGYLRILRRPLKQARHMAGETIRSFVSSEGEGRFSRMGNLKRVLTSIDRARHEQKARCVDPLKLARDRLTSEKEWLEQTEGEIRTEVEAIVAEALEDRSGRAEP
ncbi:MAG: thiamine pyrophosphate-dependent dehydrogenase E1 component subunit alpha [Candidatus Aminicenantaceae bacterium]